MGEIARREPAPGWHLQDAASGSAQRCAHAAHQAVLLLIQLRHDSYVIGPRFEQLLLRLDVLQHDANAQFLAMAEQIGATPYDIPGVELTHAGELCSFDAFLTRYRLDAPALSQLAVIVRGADTSRLDLAPQCAGLYAISLGLSATLTNDHEMLRHGLVMYDALYAWCATLQNETHAWPPAGYSLAS